MAEDLTKRVDRLERDFGASMQQIAHSLSELESVQYDHGALLKQHGRDIREIKSRVGKIEATMATKADVETLRTEVNELRAQVFMSFQHVLAVLDERLPGKAKE